MRRFRRLSTTLDQAPPAGAIVLFDGTGVEAWASQKAKDWLNIDGPADDWHLLPGGRLEAVPGAGSLITRQSFGDCTVHLEFRLLGEPTNSGVYLMSRYEIGIADTYARPERVPCGSFGNLKNAPPALADAAGPPRQWQTLDVVFRAPRLKPDGSLAEEARATVRLNGVLIYDEVALGARKGAASRLGDAATGPLMLQEHGTALQFRNIWVVE